MNNLKYLFLICDKYPISDGEFFLDDEINFISNKFENIYVLTISKTIANPREHPLNIIHLNYSSKSKFRYYINLFKALFKRNVWTDFFNSKELFKINRTLSVFNIIIADYAHGVELSNQILNFCKQNNIDLNSVVFYSYWHDKKALALALLKSKYHHLKVIARGHGWDVDYLRHKVPFLPFKNFIVQNLNLSICISSFGQNLLKSVTDKTFHDKIIVSRLGKINERLPKFEKVTKNKFLICSCSNLIALKRVNLIVELIESLSEKIDIHWIHFGDGYLNSEIRNQCSKSKISFEILQNVKNSAILDFYSENYVDIFINLSEFEGVPVSIMEAQSAGIPVLATAVGGTPEIVNNENGFLIDKNFEIDLVSEKILSFLFENSEKIKKKREAAYQNWNLNYNAVKNYSEFLNTIENI